MPGPWEKYGSNSAPDDSTSDAPSPWEKYAKNKLPTTPMLESALRGAAQGATLGFADELTGGAEALGKTLFGDKKFADLPDTYREERDLSRAAYEKARADNPTTYTLGEVGGNIGTAFVPGLGALNAAKGAGLASAVGKGALQGAIMGAGTSQADLARATPRDVTNFGEDVVTGGLAGGATGGAANVAGNVLKSLTPTNTAKKLSKVFLGTPEEVTETYIKNPEGVMNAPTRFQMSDQYQNALDSLAGDVKSGSKAARDKLTSEGVNFDSKQLADDVYGNIIRKIDERGEGSLTPTEEATKKALENFKLRLESGNPEISGNRVKDYIQDLDKTIDWQTSAGQISKLDNVRKQEARAALDQYLKGKSPAYQELMKQTASDADLLERAKAVGGEKSLPNIFRRLQNDQYGAGQAPKSTIEELDKRLGTNFLENVPLSMAKETFDKSVTNGSRNVNLFSNALRDVPVLKYAAPIIGGTVDKYGNDLARKSVDTAVAINKLWNENQKVGAVKELLSPIVDAARKGDPGAIMTFQLLDKSNPKLIRLLQNQESDED